MNPMDSPGNTLWKLLWDYDPNGLVVVDREMRITLVNPAFCEMFRLDPGKAIGMDAEDVLGDTSDLRRVHERKVLIKGKESVYSELDLYVRKVIFPIEDEALIACIVVDMSHEYHARQEILRMKREAIEQVNRVVDKQMHVAQQIAGLLGETTAETKVSLLQLRKTLEKEVD
jgi:PAS domain S-box-containing protein